MNTLDAVVQVVDASHDIILWVLEVKIKCKKATDLYGIIGLKKLRLLLKKKIIILSFMEK